MFEVAKCHITNPFNKCGPFKLTVSSCSILRVPASVSFLLCHMMQSCCQYASMHAHMKKEKILKIPYDNLNQICLAFLRRKS